MKCEVVEGDLLEQDVDIIVNAWNRNFIPWWLLLPQGVSGAIRRRSGVGPFRELAKAGVLGLGDAVMTRAGRLPLKGIIHVASLDRYRLPTREGIRRCVREALRVTQGAGFDSIGFPALGAGTGGMSVDASVDMIVDEASKHDGAMRVRVVKFRKDG